MDVDGIHYRESGMGSGQTFTWTKATRELRLEENASRDVHLLSKHQQMELEQLLIHVDLIHCQPVYTTEWLILDGTSRGSNAFPDKWELLRDWLYEQFAENGEDDR